MFNNLVNGRVIEWDNHINNDEYNEDIPNAIDEVLFDYVFEYEISLN